jgi:hypothetical protein
MGWYSSLTGLIHSCKCLIAQGVCNYTASIMKYKTTKPYCKQHKIDGSIL